MPRRSGLVLASALLLIPACSDDTTIAPDPEPEIETRHAYASGIRLTRMTVNQAVQIDLVDGNEILAPTDYPVPLIDGRATLVRGHYVVHSEFQPRELLAQLTVTYAEPLVLEGEGGAGADTGAESETIEHYVSDSLVLVDGDSVDGSLQRSFAWYLEPKYVVDGMSLRIDVFEPQEYEPGDEPQPDPDAVGAERVDAPALPWAQNSATIAADTVPLQIEVVLVPIEHHFEDCVSDASVPNAEATVMRQQLEQNNPVRKAIVSVREPMIYTDPIGGSEMGFSPILTQLSQLHADDGAAPWVYYYGLITTCDGYPGGLLGQAISIPSEIDPGLGYLRVSVGRYSGDGLAASETFVHEVGHTQGRYHVRCSGGEAGVDSDYPHIGGITGIWGFGIYDLRLRSPAGSRDYMTYCANEWVSDYGYNKVWPVIETLTQWSLEGSPDGSNGGLRADSQPWSSADFDEILVGAIYPNGTTDWWTTSGSVTGTMSSHAGLRWELDGETLSLPVWLSPRGDDETVNVIAMLPEGDLDGARFELELGAPDLEGIVVDPRSVEFDTLHRAGR